jgi:PAS domain S-box-containing protein
MGNRPGVAPAGARILLLSDRSRARARSGARPVVRMPEPLITSNQPVPSHPTPDHARAWRVNFTRRSDVEFRELLERLPVGAYICDPQGLITYFNEAAVRLWGREPRLNDPVDRFCGSFRLFTPDGVPLDHEECWMALAIREDRAYHGQEILVERPDGTRLTVLANANTIHDETGKLVAAVNVLVDISERKRAEQRLERTDRAKDEFLAMLGHELRNPLAPMHNALRIMRLATDDAAAVEHARTTIERQLQHLTRVVDELIDVSRVRHNHLTLRRERIELGTVAHQALETSAPIFEALNHQVEVTLPAKPIFVLGDALRLSQVLTSLLSNAAKYTRPGGRIWLRVERSRHEALITVRDTGIGIAPEELPTVFDLFMRTDRLPPASQSGLGIGLTLARGLTELHGGSIEVSSEGLARGSEFRVRLPIIAPEVEAPHEPPPAPVAEPAHRPHRILVVDDNADAAESLAELLTLIGNETYTAPDGETALERAAQLRPEVVLLDIGLPGISGHDVARAIRAEPWGGETMLIALTGWGQPEDRARSREAGFNHHLVKPVDLTNLEAILDEVVPVS